MTRRYPVILAAMAAVCAAFLLAGCEDGGGGNKVQSIEETHDFGSNSPKVFLAVGDSITTANHDTNVTPYTVKLEALLGEGNDVINKGVDGSTADYAADNLARWLRQSQPGYVLILAGVNDIFNFSDHEDIIADLTRVIDVVVTNKSIPVIATLLPVAGEREYALDDIQELNVMIRQLAVERDISLVDLEEEFGGDADALLMEDGLHPNDDGTIRMAAAFYDVIRLIRLFGRPVRQ